MVKCEWKKCLLKEIKYIILCLVPVPVPLVKKLWFLRFRFHNTDKNSTIREQKQFKIQNREHNFNA